MNTAVRKTGIRLVALCLLSLGFGGCIKENLDDCPDSGHRLVFFYPGNGTTDTFDRYIGTLHLELFDAEGVSVLERQYGPEELTRGRAVDLGLTDGRYTVVCWGNAGSRTALDGSRRLDGRRLYQSDYLAGDTVRGFDSLYFGRRTFTVERAADRTDTVVFVSAHINVEVYVEGFGAPPAGENPDSTTPAGNPDPSGRRLTAGTETEVQPEPDFKTKGGNDAVTRAAEPPVVQLRNIAVGYNYAMDLLPELTQIYPAWQYDTTGEVVRYAFNLLRFGDDNPIVINVLAADGSVRASVKLSDFMRQNGISVEGVNEITVPIYIRFDGVNVEVSVDGWDTSPVGPIFNDN